MMKKTILFTLLICATILTLNAQQRQITGFVQDENGEIVPGATVVLEGTTRGTITDSNGNFSINIDGPESVLVISFIGYATQHQIIGNQTNLEITMESTAEDLEEVVVVGYGTQQKISVVGAISSVDSEDLTDIATSNLSNSLAGRVSGLIIKMGEGRPGADDPIMSIRGVSTINDSSPLILIDGMEGSLSRINPNDIESFSVLKDASATAVYGVRGANGVILITTKRGYSGKPEIDVNGQYRLHKIINFPNFLGSYDHARLYNEALINVGNNPFYTEEDLEHYRTGDSPYTHPDIDWFEEVVAPYAPEQRYNISLRGGTEQVKYFVGGEFLSQEGAYRQWDETDYSTNAGYNRFNLRMNFDFQLTKTTELGVNLNGRIQDTRNIPQGASDGYGMWRTVIMEPPNLTALINPNGSIGASDMDENSAYGNLRRGSSQTEKDQSLYAMLNFKQKLDFITEGLAFRVKSGINTAMDYEFRILAEPGTYKYNPATDTYTQMQQAELPRYRTLNYGTRNNPYVEAALTYDRTFGAHKVTGLALYNQDKKSRNANPWTAHLGFAGRVTYAFKHRYLAEANLGYNGSTQFERQERYALFPAFSAGWIVSEENFFKSNISVINFFKIRGSYGTAGNDKIGNYQYLYLSIFEPGRDYSFGDAYNTYPTLVESSLANENVSWEIAKKQNYGVDMQIFNGLISLGFDYFFEKRSNILATRNTLTQVTGLQQNQLPPENFGKVNNEGFEITASLRKNFGDFSVIANGNFSRAVNTIIDIDEIKYDLEYKNRTGKSIGQLFGYTWNGEYYTFEELGYQWDELVEGANKYVLPADATPSVPVPTTPVYPGDLKFVDRNDDGVIDNFDVGAIGMTDRPEYIYGLNYTFIYKGLGLTMFWQGAGGFSRSFDSLMSKEFYNNSKVQEMHLGRWAYYEDPYTGELIDTRENATYPRLVVGASTETNKNSTFSTFRADYLRLKNIELSYQLPESLLNPMNIKSAKVTLMASNVLTFTKSKWKWIDPEMPRTYSNESVYPQTSFYGVGLNIGF
ncbi:MAG: TonB-dependent receptor [Bacteroidales bacterium]